MLLRGQKVLARCDARGDLVVEGGKVEIRYKPKDGRAYSAAVRNLAPHADGRLLADEEIGEAAPVERPAPAAKTANAAPKAGAKNAKKLLTEGAPEAPVGDEVLVYADGACSGNPGPAGLGVVMIWDDQRRELGEFLGQGTNNIAELTAILRACEAMPDRARPLRLYTDSSYAIGVLSKGWKAKANQALVAAVKDALAKLDDWELHYVRGHAGVPLNERADALAVAAVSSGRTTGWITP